MKRIAVLLILTFVTVSAQRPVSTAGAAPTIEQFLAPGTPIEIVSARKADRIAWTAYEHGQRNVYTAAAPEFKPVRLTSVTKDDGIELGDIGISDAGDVVTFVRGTQPNRDGWVANPSANPNGAERTVWAVRTAGGAAATKLGEVTTPALSPDGSTVVFAKEGQIYRYATTNSPTHPPIKSPTAYIKAWGTNSGLRWSPDGKKIAFVSNRVDHSLIGIYDVAKREVKFLAPSVDHD